MRHLDPAASADQVGPFRFLPSVRSSKNTREKPYQLLMVTEV